MLLGDFELSSTWVSSGASSPLHLISPDRAIDNETLLLIHTGDTKYGVLVGIDRYGNKYFENKNELPGSSDPSLPLNIPSIASWKTV